MESDPGSLERVGVAREPGILERVGVESETYGTKLVRFGGVAFPADAGFGFGTNTDAFFFGLDGREALSSCKWGKVRG